MVVLGGDEGLAGAVPEHQRVERGEHQTRRWVVGRPLLAAAPRAGGVERPARPGDRQRGPLREIGRVAWAVARAVAGAEDRKRLVVVDRRRWVGGVQQAVDVADDQTLRRQPRNERIDWTRLERCVPALLSARNNDARSRGRSAHNSTTSPRIALTCSTTPKRLKRAPNTRALRSANSACSHGRSDSAIRCTVPRTVHVRSSGAARTAPRVSPGTRERSASSAARRSWAWTPITARAASSALAQAVAGVSRCVARRARRNRSSASTPQCSHARPRSRPCETSAPPEARSAHRHLGTERERRHEAQVVSAPEAPGVIPAGWPLRRKQAHVLIGRRHELGAIDRLER